MCIVHPVGKGGANSRTDSKVVQALLNENLGRLLADRFNLDPKDYRLAFLERSPAMSPISRLAIDGSMGRLTLELIGEFQTRVLHQAPSDCRVDPGGATLRELRAGMRLGLTIDKLRAIMTNATQAQAARFFRASCDTNGRQPDYQWTAHGSFSGPSRPRKR
jgi:hypothetical protein